MLRRKSTTPIARTTNIEPPIAPTSAAIRVVLEAEAAGPTVVVVAEKADLREM